MGDTAGTKLREPIETRRLTAEYVNKTYILTCILQYLNRKKVLRAKILMQNVLKQQIPPRSFHQGRWIAVNFENVFPMRVSVISRCVST